MIELRHIEMRYGQGTNTVHALRDISLSIHDGEMIAICGKSGCGKTSLLNVLGALSRPIQGEYSLDGEAVLPLKGKALAAFRNHKIGFVVQHFALLADLTAEKNIALPLCYRKIGKAARKCAVDAVMKNIGIDDLAQRLPTEMSGGQKQRVAIARAIVGNPRLLLADEPTGALDEQTGSEVINLLKTLNGGGMTILLVTHDRDIAKRCDRIVTMRDGRIV